MAAKSNGVERRGIGSRRETTDDRTSGGRATNVRMYSSPDEDSRERSTLADRTRRKTVAKGEGERREKLFEGFDPGSE